MSTVLFKAGSKDFSFESRIQLKGIPLIAVEENLNEEVKSYIQKNNIPHSMIHDISIIDDNGNRAFIQDFGTIGNLRASGE